MMQNVYKIVIENERYKYVRLFQIFILFINALSLSLVAYYQNDPSFWFWPLLLFISITFIIYEKKLRAYPIFKKTSFAATGFLWAIIGWVILSHLLIAIMLAFVGILQFFVKKKFKLIFLKYEIHIPSIKKKVFSWFELQNVILKDGLLTIDFKNNKLLQSEILMEESNIKNEAEFNEFCTLQLTTIYN